MKSEDPVDHLSSEGKNGRIEAVFLDSRDKLLIFLKKRGVADAEDILHDMWLKLPRGDEAAQPIVTPLSYLYRMANSIVISRYHQRQASDRRQMRWVQEAADLTAAPAADRILQGRQAVEQVTAVVRGQGDRAYRVFCRHRLDGLTQREVAAEIGVSLTTVEGDLRRVYRALADFRTADDEV